MPFLEKFGPKNQSCQFELKFGTKTNSNMQNSLVIFTFSFFSPRMPHLGKFGLKSQSCQFNLKLVSGLIQIWKPQW